MKIVLAVVLFLYLGQIEAVAQITGKVYLDANENGVCDEGEKGMEGVAVQDGQNVVRSGKDGIFNLAGHDGARFVTLTLPDGFRASRSYYLPFAGNDRSYDLGICPLSGHSSAAYSFVQITDTETSVYGDWVDNLKEYVKANPTAFIVHTGDICYEPHQAFHGNYLRTADFGVPVYYCVGNHDLRAGKYGEALWESYFGPVWYSFEAGNVHYVVTPMLGGDHRPSYRRAELIRWLENDLKLKKKGQKVVLFNHDLWFGNEGLVFKDNEGHQIDFADYDLNTMIYGHWHNHYYKQLASGLNTYCSSAPDKGGIDHSPSCFRVYHVDKQGTLTSETRYSYIDGQLAVVLPAEKEVVYAPGGKMELRVNVYRTVSRTKGVSAEVQQNGKKVASAALRPETDWAWSGVVRVPEDGQTVIVTAEFEDGSRQVRQVDYTVRQEENGLSEETACWPGLRGNAAHTLYSEKEIVFPLRTHWVKNAGANIFMCSPIVAEGKVYVGTIDDDRAEKCWVKAFDARDGRLCWTFRTSNSVKNTIVYDAGKVFAASADGILYAIDAAKGTLCWEVRLPHGIMPPLDEGVVVADGVVYAGHSEGICAVQAKDGKILWQNKAWRGGEGTVSTMTVGDGVLVASAHWNGLFGHAVSDGTLLWKKQDSKIRFRDGSATFYDGRFYMGACENLYAWEPRSGEMVKQAETAYNFNAACAPLVTEKQVIMATSDKGVVAFDRETFKEVWNYRTGPAAFYTVPYTNRQECSVEVSPVLVGNTVVFGASDGCLHAVDVTTGAFRGKRILGAPVFSSVAAGSDALYVTDFGGNVYCLGI